MKGSTFPLLFASLAAIISLAGPTPLKGQAMHDYDSAICASNSKREETCSVTITSRSLILKYMTGRTTRLALSKIKGINTRDDSYSSGVLNLGKTKKFAYILQYENVDGDMDTVYISFDSKRLDQEFNQSIRSAR